DGANATNDCVGFLVGRVLHEQAFKAVNHNFAATLLYIFQNVGKDFFSFFIRKEGRLLPIDENRDDNFIEQLAPALNDVEVAIGDWIERTGVDGAAHGKKMVNGKS